MTCSEQENLAAIVCSHCAEGAPILRAVHSRPIEVGDSGWQFLCGSTEHDDESEATIWFLNEVLEKEPSLRKFLFDEFGEILVRSSPNEQWQVSSASN